ncbi:MAG TPA: hypothetical protein DCO77_12035, partial [Nitrospiraceae bacterium]|nr:hypothetical protein [Nitrospiraceae bacterium]
MGYYAFTIRTSLKIKELLIHQLTEQGCLGVIDNNDTFTAYFEGSISIKSVTQELDLAQALLEKAGQEHGLSYQYTLVPEENWNESWKKGFKPMDVGEGFTILPPWEKPKEGRINLIIDPGMAFGTGHHETTRSCLLLMEKHAPGVPKNRFLDVGTGTGILALAASKLGFKHILAVDNDPLAVEATRLNGELNNLSDVDIREGGITAAEGTFDLITANLISGILIEIAREIASRLSSRGIVIISGVLQDQKEEVFA